MKYLCQILFFLLYAVLSAQTKGIQHKVITAQDGLDIDVIYAMVYDNDGFLWLGGNELETRTIVLSEKKLKLQRFDGYSFHDVPIPEYGSPNITVGDIYKRKDGNFFISVRNSNEQLLGTNDNGIVDLKSLIMYPNPAKDFVNLSNPQNIALDQLAIYDLNGRLVKRESLKEMGAEIMINVSELSTASYLVIISGHNGQITKQLIKE